MVPVVRPHRVSGVGTISDATTPSVSCAGQKCQNRRVQGRTIGCCHVGSLVLESLAASLFRQTLRPIGSLRHKSLSSPADFYLCTSEPSFGECWFAVTLPPPPTRLVPVLRCRWCHKFRLVPHAFRQGPLHLAAG